MELCLIADTIAVCAAKQGIAFGKSLINRCEHISVVDSHVDQASSVIIPVDSIAPSPVRSSSNKTIRRIRKKRRTKRITFGGDSEDGGQFLLEGGGNDGPFGFGGGGGEGGKGWNYGGGGNWEEPSSWSDPAMEFVYEVICWIALSNCVHFAFKRVVRIATNGEREKLNLTLTPVC